MTRTIKARYHEGKIEPLEPLDLEEGAELVVIVTQPMAPSADVDPTTATAGAWKDALDCEQFEKDIYESRLRPPRPEVRW